jgi:hypothetical protein
MVLYSFAEIKRLSNFKKNIYELSLRAIKAELLYAIIMKYGSN